MERDQENAMERDEENSMERCQEHWIEAFPIYKKQIGWTISGRRDLSIKRLHILVCFLWFANVISLPFCAHHLKNHYPRAFGFRDTFIALYIFSTFSIIPIVVLVIWFSQKDLRGLTQVAAIAMYALTTLHLCQTLSFPESMKLIWDVKNFQNSNDTDVAFLTTYYLAVYNDCCFRPTPDDVTLPLDCNSTDFEPPCYEDEQLFQQFRSSLEIGGQKCIDLTIYDPDSFFANEQICKEGIVNFFNIVGERAYRRLYSLGVITLIYEAFALLYASQCFFWSLGDFKKTETSPGCCGLRRKRIQADEQLERTL